MEGKKKEMQEDSDGTTTTIFGRSIRSTAGRTSYQVYFDLVIITERCGVRIHSGGPLLTKGVILVSVSEYRRGRCDDGCRGNRYPAVARQLRHVQRGSGAGRPQFNQYYEEEGVVD